MGGSVLDFVEDLFELFVVEEVELDDGGC
jgi:hypothetical protein